MHDPRQLKLFSTPEQQLSSDPLETFPLCPPVIKRRSPLGEGEQRHIVLGQQNIAYTLHRSSRRSIGLQIDAHGLRIIAPKRSSIRLIEKALVEKQGWIVQKLAEQFQKNRQQHHLQWKTGETLPFMGQKLDLRFEEKSRLVLHLDSEKQELLIGRPANCPPEKINRLVKNWLQEQAHLFFSERLTYHAARMETPYHAFKLSSAKHRWGTCTSLGMIRLNWRLIHFTPALIDYVIIHELAHLKEMNHSPRFWHLVCAYCPDYKTARTQLQQQASHITALIA